MGTEAQQALQGTEAQQAPQERRAIQPSGSGRNAEGTQQARRRAIRRSGIQANRVADAPTQDSRWESGNPMGITGIDGGYGGMGHGPTSPDVDKAMRRANPAAMTREVIDTVSRPKTVRAEGSIWDDPNYAALANEHGAEYAMRARNLDRQVNQAQRLQQVREESMASRFGMEQMKRDNTRDQMAFQQEAAAYGTPDQVSRAYGAGAYRTLAGGIVRPGAQRVDPRTGLAVDEEGAFTGQQVGPAQTQAAPEQIYSREQPDTKSQAQLVESYAKILGDRSTPDDVRDLIRQQLRNTLSGGDAAVTESPWPDFPDAFQENGTWYVERDGKRYRVEE